MRFSLIFFDRCSIEVAFISWFLDDVSLNAMVFYAVWEADSVTAQSSQGNTPAWICWTRTMQLPPHGERTRPLDWMLGERQLVRAGTDMGLTPSILSNVKADKLSPSSAHPHHQNGLKCSDVWLYIPGLLRVDINACLTVMLLEMWQEISRFGKTAQHNPTNQEEQGLVFGFCNSVAPKGRNL